MQRIIEGVQSHRHARSLCVVAVASLLSFGAARQAAAQPSNRRIKKDMMNPGVKKITFGSKRGTKQWNSSTKTFEYSRVVHIVREYKEIKGVDLVVVGAAVYQRFGRKWKYWKFRLAENRYLGIPNPTEKEILALINKDLRKFVSSYMYNKIVGSIKKVGLAPEPKWKWHKPTRVEFRMLATYDAIVSYTDVESIKQEFKVSLYRDKYKSPWTSFGSTAQGKKSLGKKKYTSQQIKAMKTLGAADSERKSRASAAKLPKVNVPKFKSGAQLMLFTHKMLRNSTPETLEAYLMKALAPFFFNNKAAGQLNQRGADAINKAIKRAFKLKGTYKLEYCENAGIDRKRSSKTRFYILGAINKVNTVIAVGMFGGAYKDGVKVGKEWMITEISVGTRQDNDALQFINSFSSRKKLCPKDKI
jgi:hypothetical protein